MIKQIVQERRPGAIGYGPPDGYEAYARIFHPMYPGDRREAPIIGWADAAALGGFSLEATTSWEAIQAGISERKSREWWFDFDLEPVISTLPYESREVLSAILTAHVPSMPCWFGVWFGYADLDPMLRQLPLMEVARRETHVFPGDVSQGVTNTVDPSDPVRTDRGPNVWLAGDATWLVTTELYSTSTFVAGDADLIEAVVGDPRLEARAIAYAAIDALR